MYLSFYGLQKKPFQVSTDPAFLWLGEKHKEALAILKYGNLGNQGIILLTGDPGTGKTTLINALLNSLGDEVIVGKVPDPGMEVIDFMNYVSHAFGMHKKFVSKDAFLIHFGHFLNSTHAAGKKSLLIIDEAQRLSPALLEEIRQLSNIEKQETKLLSIFFVGQSEFNDVLLEHKNRALRQRISLNYVIEPLDLYETGEFIRHRLNIAGAEEDIFSPDAIRNVYEFSGGFPRSVNIICDHSLLLGFGESTKTVTGEIVKDCAKDLLPPEFLKNKNNKSQQSVDTADSDILEEIPPERIQEVSSRKGWKTFSYVALIAMVVFTITVIMYPVEHWDLFSRGNNNELQSYSGESEVNRLSANSYPEQDREIISIEGVSTNLKTMGAEEDGQEASTAQELLVEDVKPVTTLSEGNRPDIPEEKPIVPDSLNKGAVIPEDGKDRIATSSFHSAQLISPSNPSQKNPSSEEKTQKNAIISETNEVVNKEPEDPDPGALIDRLIIKRSK